jgi:hypothetical protein
MNIPGFRKITTLALLLLVLSGCVLTKTPLGDAPLNLSGHESEWEGTWFDGEGAVRVKVEDAAQGILQAGWVDEHEGNLVFTTIRFQLRKTADRLYANFELKGLNPPQAYRDYLVPARITLENRRLEFWLMDDEVVGDMVRKGAIPGRVESDVVIVDKLYEAQLMSGTDNCRKLFEWAHPRSFYKLTNVRPAIIQTPEVMAPEPP